MTAPVTTTYSTMSSTSAHTAYQDLLQRLRRLRRKHTAARCLTGLCLTLACGLGTGLVLLLFEAGIYLSPTAKLLLEAVASLGLIGLLARFCLYPLLAPPPLEEVALCVERHFGGLKQRLISALQLWRDRERDNQGASPHLIAAAVVQATQIAADLDLDATVDRARPLRMAGLCGGMALLVLGCFGLWTGPIRGAASRLAHPQTAYVRPSDTRIELRPGNAEVIAGDPFEIYADLSGVVPPQARLTVREEGVDIWTPLDLPVRQNRVKHRFGTLTRSLAYRLQANDAETPAYTLTVRARPMVTQIVRHYHYPDHTRLGERREVEGGDIVAPTGTSVRLQIQASLPLEEAWLDFDNNTRLPTRINDRTAQAELTVIDDRRYTIGLLDPHMIPNRDPVEYRIVALQDHPPEVRLLRPGADSELGETMQVPLLAEAHDDFGVSRMEVRYTINDGAPDQTLPVALDTVGAKDLTQGVLWDLSGLDLLPGDQVTYRMRVYDNNTVSGPTHGESTNFTVRFPSLFEIHQEAQLAQQKGLEQMESMWQAGKELQKRLGKVAHELLKEGNLEWQERKELETSLEEQTRAGERLKQIMQKLNETLDRLESSGLMAAETLQKLEEIRELFSQIETPELKQAMEKLQEALKAVDPDAVQEALNAFRDEQEAFQQTLDRSIALLKRVQHQQNLDALVKGMEELAAEQQEVVEDLRKEAQPQTLAEREDLLAHDTQRLQDELARAAEQMPDPTGEDLHRLADELGERRVAGRIARVGQILRAGQIGPARQQAQAVAKDLQELTRQLRQTRQAFVQNQKTGITRELNRALHDLLSLSRDQEQTARQAEGISRDTDPTPLALEQARIFSGANRMAQRLSEASRKTFFITPQTSGALGQALQKMEEAADHIQRGNASRAARSAKKAMGDLNTAALSVRQGLTDLAFAASALGFEEMLQRMQQLSGQQGELNAQTEALFQQQRPGEGTQMSLNQLAARQRGIEQALEELLASLRQQLLGDLRHVASEMEEVAEDLQRRRITQQTLKRQRRILSRLLDAQRSVRQRGWSKQRKARQGRKVAYRGPGSLPSDLGEADNPLRRRLRDALREGYPAEYQGLIRRYFESLMQDALAKGQNNQNPK